MKTAGFIGCYDKTDLIIYVAKVLTKLGKKVLVVDNTSTQKARYVVPTINPAKSYVTEFEGIDFAIGFNDYEEIKKYLGAQEEFNYDISLVDVDSIEVFEKYNLENCQKKYFVTSFDLYSLKKGIKILENLSNPGKIIKVLYAKDILKEEDEYLNFLTLGTKVIWDEKYRIYFPIDNGDQSVIIENQRVSKIAIRKLSAQYKESLYYIIEDIMATEMTSQEIKKVFKNLEKEG